MDGSAASPCAGLLPRLRPASRRTLLPGLKGKELWGGGNGAAALGGPLAPLEQWLAGRQVDQQRRTLSGGLPPVPDGFNLILLEKVIQPFLLLGFDLQDFQPEVRPLDPSYRRPAD